jgi:hypothetical protein
MLTMFAAILALVTFVSTPSDPFAATESKPSCREIERNDELYFGAGKEEWIRECRTEKIENLSDIFG